MQSLLELFPPIPPAQCDPLAALLGDLVPVIRFGLEHRLGAAEHAPIDLQQCFGSVDDEPARLVAWLQRSPRKHPCWQRLLSFCQKWPELKAIQELWLEFDALEIGGGDEPLPSIFLALGAQADRDTVQSVLTTALHLLLDNATATAAQIEEALRWLPPGAHLSHVGLFTSRVPFDVRINVGRVPPQSVASFLRSARVEGADEIAALVRQLNQFVDSVRLGLSLLTPGTVGLECLFTAPGQGFRWEPLFEWLLQLRLVGADECARWQSWPRMIDPLTLSAPWPAASLVADLLRGGRTPPALRCRLNHVKLVYTHGGALSAKLYCGIEQIFSPPPLPSDGKFLNAASPRRLGRADVRRSLDAAVRFLRRERTPSGWWLDYDTSDCWVTAYTAQALAHTADASCIEVARDVWDLLQDRLAVRPEGFGWNLTTPPDADSTAWVVLLAKSLCIDEVPRRALDCLHEHTRPDGGVVCYGAHLWNGEHTEGWGAVHTCITANLSRLEECREKTLPYLRSAQLAEGCWTGYWWPDEHYPTTLAILALTDAVDDERRLQAGRWLRKSLGAEGRSCSRIDGRPSVFLTALALEGILAALEAVEARHTVQWLLDEQRLDGSWPASACLYLPKRNDPCPHGHADTTLLLDHRRIFTTATVVRALATLLQSHRWRWDGN